jgi:hypothetical protein
MATAVVNKKAVVTGVTLTLNLEEAQMVRLLTGRLANADKVTEYAKSPTAIAGGIYYALEDVADGPFEIANPRTVKRDGSWSPDLTTIYARRLNEVKA